MGLRARILGLAVGLTFAPAAAASAAENCLAMNTQLAEMAAQIEADDISRAQWVVTFNEARDARNNAQADLDLAIATQAPAEEIETLRADYSEKRDAAAEAKSKVEALNGSLNKQAAAFGEKRMIFNARCVKD